MDEGGYKVSGYHLIYMGFRYTVYVPSGIGLVIWKEMAHKKTGGC